MDTLKKKYYPPIVEIQMIYHEESIATASITPHIDSSNIVTEDWEESEVIFDKVQW